MFRYFWPAYLWGIIVLVLTGMPGNDVPSLPPFWNAFHPDKIAHVGLFGMLVFLLAAGSYFKGGKISVKKSLITLYAIIGIALGGIIELLQKWVFIGRSCELGDFIADIIGVILAIIFYYILFEKKSTID
jgi:VanZ family protein